MDQLKIGFLPYKEKFWREIKNELMVVFAVS